MIFRAHAGPSCATSRPISLPRVHVCVRIHTFFVSRRHTRSRLSPLSHRCTRTSMHTYICMCVRMYVCTVRQLRSVCIYSCTTALRLFGRYAETCVCVCAEVLHAPLRACPLPALFFISDPRHQAPLHISLAVAVQLFLAVRQVRAREKKRVSSARRAAGALDIDEKGRKRGKIRARVSKGFLLSLALQLFPPAHAPYCTLLHSREGLPPLAFLPSFLSRSFFFFFSARKKKSLTELDVFPSPSGGPRLVLLLRCIGKEENEVRAEGIRQFESTHAREPEERRMDERVLRYFATNYMYRVPFRY